ncbi:phosphatase PAP2 family protein [Chelatococcus sp. GCM10030263]|uniref:phosphatase PAP2 family protein n=1 Tax=Chelatococcus sp. GCM10030263 TaxID=3273387 RepID=UPI0036138EEF
MMHRITGLGDVAVLVPVAALVALYCFMAGHRRLALQWSLMILVGMALTGVAKLTFHACGDMLTGDRIRSPSGHAALSMMVFGGLAIVMAGGRDRIIRVLFALGGAVLVLLIGWSRVRLNYHTRSEVLAGFMLGGFCLAVFSAFYKQERLSLAGLVLISVFLGLTAYALRKLSFTPEYALEAFANRLQIWLDVCR